MTIAEQVRNSQNTKEMTRRAIQLLECLGEDVTELTMNKCDCANCVCLVKGINGEWVCDEVNKNIEDIKHCPEETNFWSEEGIEK